MRAQAHIQTFKGQESQRSENTFSRGITKLLSRKSQA